MTRRPLTLFVGPTTYGMDLTTYSDDISVRPPVRRGQIEHLLNNEAQPGVIGIVDGTFHAYPAVGHAELRNALAAGWTIWGLASMGAIRAAEMAPLGMRGYGRVYQQFYDDTSFADDEVTLVHGSEPPYRPMSEPMVHMRSLLSYLLNEQLITSTEHLAVIADLKQRWFGDRTIPALAQSLQLHTTLRTPAIAATLTNMGQHRTKQQDLHDFLSSAPWKYDDAA